MKIKFRLVPLVFGALFAIAHADNAPVSILSTNPGFEDGIEGWSLKDTDAVAKLSQVLPEAAHTGKMGLRVNQAAGQSGQWIASSQMLVVPQQKYRITFWVRTLADSHAAVSMRFIGADGSNSIDTAKPPLNMLQIQGGIYDWTECQFDAQAPTGAVGAVIAVHAYNKAACEADFDDFSVVPVNP
jgi:hypothetical protein